MKTSRTKNRFETGFQQPKTGLAKNGLNIPSCLLVLWFPLIYWLLIGQCLLSVIKNCN